MRSIFFVILFFTLNFAFAQEKEYKLIIKDAETQEPIEDVIVNVLKTRLNYVSNSQGMVSFKLKGVSGIQLVHTTYQTQNLRTSNLKSKENVIFLKSAVNQLDEVVISLKNPQKILKQLIENSKAKLTAPCRLRVYGREFFKLDGKYSFYTDGLVNYVISDKEKKFKNDILIEQNRTVGLVEKDIHKDLVGYNLNNLMENYYSFKYLEQLTDPEAKKKYLFTLKPYTENDKYYVIYVKPKTNATGFTENFKIIYDEKEEVIIELESQEELPLITLPEVLIPGTKYVYRSNFKNTFRYKNENEYYLLSSREEIGYWLHDKKNKKKEIEVRNYLVTNTFSRNRFAYTDKDIFKDKSFLVPNNKIITDYWNDSGLVATPEEERIIKSLR